MARPSKQTLVGIAAAVGALALAAGVVGAVGALEVDDPVGDQQVQVLAARAGATEVETTTADDHSGHAHDDGHDHGDGTAHDEGHDDGHEHGDDATHDDGHDHTGGDDDGHDHGGGTDDGHDHGTDDGHDHGTDDGHDHGGGTDDGHDHGTDDGDPDPCDSGHQHAITVRATTPKDCDPDPDPCDSGHQHAITARATTPKDCDPDPCDGHVHTADASDPCNPDPCDDTGHQHAITARSATSATDCDPDPCAGHVHTTDPNDPCNPDPCDDTGHHHGAAAADPATDPASCTDAVQYDDLPAEVRALVDQGTATALQYPTAALAQAAGWGQITIYFPLIAQHNLKSPILDATFDPANPEVLLYGQDGQLVGINYIVRSGATPPEGFPGDADHWHEHPALCLSLTTSLVIGGEDLSAAECSAIGGYLINFQGFWLLHVWTIPGYDSPEGVFSHENSKV